MITLRRLDLVRQDSMATAEELSSLQTQLNALPLIQVEPQVHLLATPHVAPLNVSMEPSGYLEITVRGTTYVLPFFAKV